MPVIPDPIDEYARLHSSREDPLLAELARDTFANAKLPQMQTGHLEGSFLRILAAAIGARRVLEIGTYTGYSALCLASGLPDDGVVITCDRDPEATDMARRYWAKSPHGRKIDLRMGNALDTLKTLDGPFDLAFIDADKENYVRYWEACLPKVRPGGILAVDNVLWSGRVLNPKDPLDHAIVAFNLHVRYDDRVDLVMLTIRDGLTLARKK